MLKRFFLRIYRFIARFLSAWLGWRVAKEFFQDCRRTGKTARQNGVLSASRERYRENLAGETELRALPFEKVLTAWGILTDEDLTAAVRTNRHARISGILLTMVFGLFCAWHLFLSGQSAWWRTLHGMAGFSFLIAGLLRLAWRGRRYRTPPGSWPWPTSMTHLHPRDPIKRRCPMRRLWGSSGTRAARILTRLWSTSWKTCRKI